VKPILSENGLVLLQPLDDTKLTTIIYDVESGESISGSVAIPTVADPQKLGSAISYLRRYSLVSTLAIEGDEDDDANTASAVSAPKAPVALPVPPQSTTTAKCDKCAAPMKISSAGKPYCSKLCWKNPVQALPVIQQEATSDEVPLSDIPF
jgi:hypothetical protein